MKVYFVVCCWFALAFLFHNDNHDEGSGGMLYDDVITSYNIG